MKMLLKNLRFNAYHGVLPQERIVGAFYRVDLEVWFDYSQAMRTDDLADTIDYTGIYEVVKEQMGIPSKLLEHVANRIVVSLLEKYGQIERVDIRLLKERPPIEGIECDGCGVEISKTRESRVKSREPNPHCS